MRIGSSRNRVSVMRAGEAERLDRAARDAGERLLRAMFFAEVRGKVDVWTDKGARAWAVRLEMTPEQAVDLAGRLEQPAQQRPRGLMLRGLARLRDIVQRRFE